MNILYLDCGMGAAGDMLCAALLELLPDPDAVLAELNGLGIPHVRFERTPSVKCGITGTHLTVTVHGAEEHEHSHGHHHAHSDLASIETILSGLHASDRVKADALAVYRMIADAESAVHGCPVTEIHFHEVGALDAIADVTAFCFLTERLHPDAVLASPVHVGSGTVRCAHGVLPVPAPATAVLLKGIPIYGGEIKGELCTPTGAALLKRFVTHFGDMPAMRVQSIGYGMGTKDFDTANCVRAMLGTTEDKCAETVFELSANVDDMTAEQIGYALERLFEAGAVDAVTVPIGMKKNRPGTLIRAIVRTDAKDAVLTAFFRHTTTLGVRELETKRHILSRRIDTYETELGTVRVKRAEGFGIVREKIEYEDAARIARERNIPLSEATAAAEKEVLRNG